MIIYAINSGMRSIPTNYNTYLGGRYSCLSLYIPIYYIVGNCRCQGSNFVNIEFNNYVKRLVSKDTVAVREGSHGGTFRDHMTK